MIFFLSHYNLSYSKKSAGRGFVPISAKERIIQVTKGDVRRRIAFLSLGIIGIILLFRNKGRSLRINGFLGWIIIFYLIWAFCSIIWANDIILTLRRLFVLIMLCLGALGLVKKLSIHDIILMIFSISSLYLLLGIITEIIFGTFQLSLSPEYRFAGIFHPIYQAINCALLLLSAVFLMKSPGHKRSLFLAIAVVALIFLILTKSRAALTSVMLALFIYWFMNSSFLRKFNFFLGMIFIFCLLLLLIGSSLFPMFLNSVELGRRNPAISDATGIKGRISLWEDCFIYVARRPILGYGYNGFWIPRHIYDISIAHGWVPGGSHCAYIDILLDLGIVGMLVFILIFIIGIRQSFVFNKSSSNDGYQFFIVLLIFSILSGLFYSVISRHMFLTFLNMVILGHLGFQRSHAFSKNKKPVMTKHNDY